MSTLRREERDQQAIVSARTRGRCGLDLARRIRAARVAGHGR